MLWLLSPYSASLGYWRSWKVCKFCDETLLGLHLFLKFCCIYVVARDNIYRLLIVNQVINDIRWPDNRCLFCSCLDCKYHWTGNIRGVLYFWTFDFQQLKATCPAKPVTVNCWSTYLQQRCWLFMQLAYAHLLDVGWNHGFLSENSARFDIKGMILAIGLASFVGIVLLDCNFLISAMPMVAIVVS